MANPLFNQIMGGTKPNPNPGAESQQAQPGQGTNGQQMSMQDAMSQLRSNPAQIIRQAGFNVPDELANDPRAATMHLIQSGQVRGPMMQRIQPMLNMLMGRR